MLKKLHLLICIIAAIVVCILNLANDVPFENAATNLITIIVVFYILGVGAKYYLSKYVFPPEPEEEQLEEAEVLEDSPAEPAPVPVAAPTNQEDFLDDFVVERRRQPRRPVAVSIENEEDQE